jgi:hypothetical protein
MVQQSNDDFEVFMLVGWVRRPVAPHEREGLTRRAGCQHVALRSCRGAAYFVMQSTEAVALGIDTSPH